MPAALPVILEPKELKSFETSGFFHSLSAIDNFFDAMTPSLIELGDDELLQFFTLLTHMGNKVWYGRCLVLEEIEIRVKKRLDKDRLSKEEFELNVAKPIDLQKSAAYEDLKILHLVRESGLEPRLDRQFYRLALTAPDFKEAIEYAEDQNDAMQGKYSPKTFAVWIADQKGDGIDFTQTPDTIDVNLSTQEINILLDGIDMLGSINVGNTTELEDLSRKLSEHVDKLKAR